MTLLAIGPKTKISLRLATLITAAAFIWQAAVVADSYRDIILSNSEAVQILTKALQLSNLDDEIGDLKRERRVIKAKMTQTSNQELLHEYKDQIEEITDSIVDAEKIRECIVSTAGPCE